MLAVIMSNVLGMQTKQTDKVVKEVNFDLVKPELH